MATHAVTASSDEIGTLTPAESRQAFEKEVERRLGIDAPTFIEQWRSEKLERNNPDVSFLLSLLPIYGPLVPSA